jgi:hypothetical protein
MSCIEFILSAAIIWPASMTHKIDNANFMS